MPFKKDSFLKRWYTKFNRIYFDNKLPEDVDIGWNELDGMYGTLAVNIWTSKEDGLEHKVLQIHIDPRKHHGREQYFATLLHEMVHVKLIPYRQHGKKFKDEMHLLMVKGAFDDLL